MAGRMAFGADDVTDLELAVGEACNNAVKHGREGRTHLVRIRCNVDPASIEIEVRNRYDGTPPKEPLGTRPNPTSYTEGGLGVRLMKSLVDDVDFQWGKQIAAVRLTKRVRLTQA